MADLSPESAPKQTPIVCGGDSGLVENRPDPLVLPADELLSRLLIVDESS